MCVLIHTYLHTYVWGSYLKENLCMRHDKLHPKLVSTDTYGMRVKP